MDSYGASVQGPHHLRQHKPNEDAWLRAVGRYGSLIVVCDGMGSRANARIGAKCACRVVREAVSKWAQAEQAPTSYLLHLIEVYWRLAIYPLEPASAATTCLFSLAAMDGTWFVGGLGDGLALLKTGDELEVIQGEREDSFGNVTEALGVSKGIRSWKLCSFPATNLERMAVLATDGIADDLLPEKLGEFCLWLAENFSGMSPAQRWRLLTNELRAWPTPRHQDDKTLAVLHAPQAAG